MVRPDNRAPNIRTYIGTAIAVTIRAYLRRTT
jgi:hypothetical protein